MATIPPDSSDSNPLAVRLERQQRALLAIGSQWRHYEGDLVRAIRAITETATLALEIARASVWLYHRERGSILCKDLYEAGPRRHSRGAEISATEFPDYFEALEGEEVIVAEDAHTDPRTCAMSSSYLEPHGIGAMLDAPIRMGGKLVGVLCHEHLGGPRAFHQDEVNTAVYLANMISVALEVQRRTESELEARRSLSLLRAAFEASGSALLALDTEGRVITCNERAVVAWRLTPELLAGDADPRALMHHMAAQTADPDHFVARTRAVVSQPRAHSLDTIELPDGRVIECASQPQLLDDRVIGRVWSYRDITRRHRLESELRELSYRDLLTGLANRRRAQEALEVEVLRARRSGQRLCVAMVDIDRFKRINDLHGHPVGDEVLRALASDLVERLRATDLAGRWGGEEFLLILPDTELDNAARVVDALRGHVARERRDIPSFTVSAGLAELRDEEAPAALIARADEKLYAAKQAGRNRVAA